MTAETFQQRSDGWFSIAKIFALIVVGAWTYYQWDRTIFPKEDYAARIRASNAAIDLSIEAPQLVVGALVLADDPATDYGNMPTLARVDMAVANDRPFPVMMQATAVRISMATVARAPEANETEWREVATIAPEDFFGPELDTPRLVESGARALLGGQHLFRIDWLAPSDGQADGATLLEFQPISETEGNFALVRVDMKLILSAVDPRSGEVILDATNEAVVEKTKSIRLQTVTYAGMRYFDAQDLAGRISVPTVAERVPPILGDPAFPGWFLEVPG